MKVVRRFLLAPALARLISRERGVDRQIVEGYLSGHSGKNQFVRLEADQCHLVLPLLGPAGELMEDLAPLPRAHAKALFDLSSGQISYDQLHLPLQSNSCQRALLERIDHPSNCDIIIVEFDDQQHAAAFEAPLWFGPEVTSEYTYEQRSIALNGLSSNSDVPLSGLQLEQVLDILEQPKLSTRGSSRGAAHDIIVAPARTLKASGTVTAADEATVAFGLKLTTEDLTESTERLAQQAISDGSLAALTETR
jgi:CYTH domain-containing protein